MRYAYELLVPKPEGNKPLGRPSVDGKILKWIVGKYGLGCRLDSYSSG
jgi:hypothetical protein